MTPIPEEHAQNDPGEKDMGEDIVISGMAGLYPSSRHVKELSEMLYNKINPVQTTDRWTSKYPEAPKCIGTIPDLEYFDAQFFKVHYRLSECMDPMCRKLLEQSYQAIFDAGYNPEQLSGRKVGVFVGSTFSETEKALLYISNAKSGLGLAGCNRSMLSNRISYYLNLKGPSTTIDMSSCSSSGSLEMAYDSIARGECEAAIVGGAGLCLHPHTAIQFGRTADISKDGKTKSFDANADGCAMSEAINIVFLQKAKDALRIYARVVHVKSEFISVPQSDNGAVFSFDRNIADITRFLKNFYEEANVSPNEIQFVEAFGSGGQQSDKVELVSIDEVFCKNRSKPLMVGSVMSNIGFVDTASGLASVTKVLLGYHFGKLAANLNYKTPRDDIAAIRSGRIEILSDHKEFIPTYTAINNFSLTGIYSHILLHGYNKKKDIQRYKAGFPRLVLTSGRDETSVKKIFDYLKSKPIDPEEHALLHSFFEKRVWGHLGRGFIILDKKENDETVNLHEECAYFDEGKRPLWFVYSGMGSQWVGMGKHLMRIPVFAAAIERCHRVLEPRGINIVDIITSDDKNTFNNILHSFVGINAIQIGLTDVLRALNIVPDMLIGHSMGEYCCAYADGCFTAEETILCAYSRGLFSLQTPFIRGSMAAVGLGYKEMSKICPPEIIVACHNSAESCTISGPAEIMSEFVSSLTSQGIFAKEVACSNIAYHSPYVADAGPALLKYMQDLIKTPRPRSSRWVSTSVPQDRWDEPLAKYSSAEYHLNNFLSPVLFEETSQLIPSDAVLIEIAPHGLLQAILKRSLPTCKQLSLTRRGHPDNSQYLLEAIGRLYMEGFNPQVQALYPKVEFPVSTSTPMLSHLVDWVYQEKWCVQTPIAANKRTAATSQNVISLYDVEHNYLKGHVIKGKNLYPFSAALVSVWDTLAASLNLKKQDLSVQFENVILHSQPILTEKHQLRPYVAIQKGTGHFEVLNGKSLIISGIVIPEITSDRLLQNNPSTSQTNVSSHEIYDEIFYAKGYQYFNDFRSIHSANESLTRAQIEWKDNWVTFLDGIIQVNVLSRKHDTLSKLNLIRRITIDVDKQRIFTDINDDKVLVNAKVLKLQDVTICGGVVMESLKFFDLPSLKKDNVELKTCEFVPLFSDNKTNEMKALSIFLQIVADNVFEKEINIVEIMSIDGIKSNYSDIELVINKVPGVKANYYKLSSEEKCRNRFENIDILLTSDLLSDEKMCHKLRSVLRQDTFIIHKNKLGQTDTTLYKTVSALKIEGGRMELAIWRPTKPDPLNTLVVRTPKNYSSKDVRGGEYIVPLEDESYPKVGDSLKIRQIGDLTSLYWANEDSQNNVMGVSVKVNYVGVNIVFVKKLLATQFYEDNEPTKSVIDFSGITKSGSRVMGLLHSNVVFSQLNANPELLLPVPQHWTLEDAATVPLAYSMAFYILFIKARMKSEHVICVQGAAGALGQAVTSVALAHGCEVFALVSSSSKKQFMKKLFPQLKDNHIIDHSRDYDFVNTVLCSTNGKGCNVLISCATDELKNFSVRCIAPAGMLIDTAVVPQRENFYYGMSNMKTERMYFPIDFSTIFQTKFSGDIKLLRLLMIDGIRRGYVRPLTRVTYDALEAPRAFRLQAAGNNRGRVLLDLRQLKQQNTISRVLCSSCSWQLIASDSEKLALKLAERLIKRGAKNLVILLDNLTNVDNLQKRKWQKDDVNVRLLKTTWKKNDFTELIKDFKKSNSLESVLIITSNERATKVIDVVNLFDEFVSKSRYPLKYFALITVGKVNIKPGSWIGTNGHIGTIAKINLPDMDLLYGDNSKPFKRNMISTNSAMDALERALASQKKIIIVHTADAPRKTLLEEVMALAGVDPEIISQNSHHDLTLEELNMDDPKLLSIQGFLCDEYEISLSIEDIQKLTLESINDLENYCIESNLEEHHGIASYFPTLYTEELLYTSDMLFLPTLASPAASNNDIDMNKPYLCVIPGVEGYYKRFTELCERLKLPAVVLQPGIDHPNETYKERANRFINVLRKRAAINQKFYLLGYESGVLVALEMAAILESEGSTGKVYCIGGSPTEIIEEFRTNLKDYKTQEQLQIGVLKHAYSFITKSDSSVLDVLPKDSEWLNKLDKCMDLMRGKYSYSIQYTKKWIDYVYRQLSSILTNTYKCKQVNSQIICIRPQYDDSIDDSFENYSTNKIITYQLESSLSHAHLNMMCSTIINSHLDRDTLEMYEEKNICHTYAIATERVTA